jgi:hypothetical protein
MNGLEKAKKIVEKSVLEGDNILRLYNLGLTGAELKELLPTSISSIWKIIRSKNCPLKSAA